jgi:hypothetical protein
MSTKRNGLLAVLLFFGLTLVPAYFVLADDGLVSVTPADPELWSPTAPERIAAPPVAAITDAYLSDKQFGTSKGGKKIDKIRPGETIWGVYNVTASGDCPRLSLALTYKIAKYKQSYYAEPDFPTPVKRLVSWGFEIPDYKAVNGDQATFYFKFNAIGYGTIGVSNTVSKSLGFTVIRKGIANSTRVYQKDPPNEPQMTPAQKTQIINNVKAVQSNLQASPLKFDAVYYPSSATATAFLSSLQTLRPNATLIHAHGNSIDLCGRIYLVDNSYVDVIKVQAAFTGANAKYKLPPGLVYAAVCEGAKYSGLGLFFNIAGCKAFISYTQTVLTMRNTAFYKYFFAKATQPNVTVSAALAAARSWAIDKKWTDVASALIIGDGKIYLGGKTTTTSAAQEDKEIEAVTLPYTDWRNISKGELANYEMAAVLEAEQLPQVQDLKDKYGANLVTGIEDLVTVYRVAYKDKAKGIFLYGVDVDKNTGKIVDQGELD